MDRSKTTLGSSSDTDEGDIDIHAAGADVRCRNLDQVAVKLLSWRWMRDAESGIMIGRQVRVVRGRPGRGIDTSMRTEQESALCSLMTPVDCSWPPGASATDEVTVPTQVYSDVASSSC